MKLDKSATVQAYIAAARVHGHEDCRDVKLNPTLSPDVKLNPTLSPDVKLNPTLSPDVKLNPTLSPDVFIQA
jgi:hypothetical protein